MYACCSSLSPSGERLCRAVLQASAPLISVDWRVLSSRLAILLCCPLQPVTRRLVMEVILKEDVNKLGQRGDVVKVADGYGRNFLLPQKLAMEATAANKVVTDRMKKPGGGGSAKKKS